MSPTLASLFDSFDSSLVSTNRKNELAPLVTYLRNKQDNKQNIQLVFVCTHNSRRSQFAQFWSHVASEIFQLPISSYSAGTEVTEANPRTIRTLKNLGVHFTKEGDLNPHYVLDLETELVLFSKDIYHPSLPQKEFAAIMTCSHADKNCPYIANCEERIPMRFTDPKEYDDTEFEVQKYLEKAIEIGTEIKYVFSQLTEKF